MEAIKTDTLTLKKGAHNGISQEYTIKAGRRVHAKLYKRAAGDCQLIYGGMAFNFSSLEAAINKAAAFRLETLEAFGNSYKIEMKGVSK